IVDDSVAAVLDGERGAERPFVHDRQPVAPVPLGAGLFDVAPEGQNPPAAVLAREQPGAPERVELLVEEDDSVAGVRLGGGVRDELCGDAHAPVAGGAGSLDAGAPNAEVEVVL